MNVILLKDWGGEMGGGWVKVRGARRFVDVVVVFLRTQLIQAMPSFTANPRERDLSEGGEPGGKERTIIIIISSEGKDSPAQ